MRKKRKPDRIALLRGYSYSFFIGTAGAEEKMTLSAPASILLIMTTSQATGAGQLLPRPLAAPTSLFKQRILVYLQFSSCLY